jgi:PST family polysaccharide transporter
MGIGLNHTRDPAPAPSPSRALVIRAAVWSAIQAWGIRVLTLGVFVLLARMLTPQDFGLVAMAAVFISLVQVLLEQGFGEAIIQRPQLGPRHLDTAFWLNAGAGLLLFLLTLGLAGPAAAVMGEPALADCLRVLAVTFVLSGLGSVPQAYLKRQFGFKALALRSLVASAVGSGVALVLAWLGFGVWALVAQSLVFTAVGTALVWVVSPWRPGWTFSPVHAVEMGRFAASSLGTRLTDFLNNRMLDFLVGFFYGAEALGYFTIGSKLVVVFNQMLTFVATQVSLSAFSRLQQDLARLRAAYCRAIKLTSLLTFAVFGALSLLAAEVIPALFGEHWRPSVPVLQVYAFMGMLLSTTYLNGTALTAIGRPARLLALTVAELLLRFGAVMIAWRFGLAALVPAYVATAALSLPLGHLLMRRHLGIGTLEYLRCYGSPLAGLMSMAAAVLALSAAGFMPESAWLRLIVGGFAGLLAYLATAAVLERALLGALPSRLQGRWVAAGRGSGSP